MYSENFDLSFAVRFYVYFLAFCFEFEYSQTAQKRAMQNICVQEIIVFGYIILRLYMYKTFNSGLALTGFQTTQS